VHLSFSKEGPLQTLAGIVFHSLGHVKSFVHITKKGCLLLLHFPLLSAGVWVSEQARSRFVPFFKFLFVPSFFFLVKEIDFMLFFK